MTRNRPRPAVRTVLAPAGAQQQESRERGGGAGQVDDRGAREVEHLLAADVVQQAEARPDRVGDDRVDQRPKDDREQRVGAELDPLQGRSPDDRQRDRREGESVQHAHGVGTGDVERVSPLSDRLIEVEEEAAGPEDLVTGGRVDAVADRPPSERDHGEVDEDLGDTRADVLLPRETNLEQQESRLHEEHQDAGDHDPEVVQLQVQSRRINRIRLAEGHPRQDQGNSQRQQGGQAQALSHRLRPSLPASASTGRSRITERGQGRDGGATFI